MISDDSKELSERYRTDEETEVPPAPPVGLPLTPAPPFAEEGDDPAPEGDPEAGAVVPVPEAGDPAAGEVGPAGVVDPAAGEVDPAGVTYV